MPKIYDVIIVGGGPAGSTAAFFLGEAGRRVLVLEKQTLPRYKTCGGGLAAGVLDQFPFSFEPVIESHVKAVTYALRKWTVTIPMPDRPMRMVMRDRFDAHILAHARAEICQKTAVRKVTEIEDRVIVETRAGETFEGRYLIAADGANSIVARSLGLRQRKNLAGAIEVEAPVTQDVMDKFADFPLFIFGEIPLGYLWVFPKSDHLSVGIAALHPGPGELQATLQRVMAQHGISLKGIPMHGHPIPLYTGREPIATRRTLLAGDAAGLVDPFNGEGIRFAIKSGRLAAEAILSGRLDTYSRLVQRQIGLNHSFAKFLAFLFYTFPRTCFLLGVRNPFATLAFVDLLSERIGYPQVILRLFGSLPIYLLTEGVAALAGLLGGPERRRWVRAAVYPATGD